MPIINIIFFVFLLLFQTITNANELPENEKAFIESNTGFTILSSIEKFPVQKEMIVALEQLNIDISKKEPVLVSKDFYEQGKYLGTIRSNSFLFLNDEYAIDFCYQATHKETDLKGILFKAGPFLCFVYDKISEIEDKTYTWRVLYLYELKQEKLTIYVY